MEWAEGYPAGSGYTFGYYRPLNPVFARFALRLAGLAVPPVRTACELGFGQGVSVAMHAAASGADWWGTDFMPGQAAYAQDLAGPRAMLAEQSFAEFCARPDLPDFDYVCAHGIWSWVSAENRAVITDFLRRKLRPGGVFHVSYNADPGWASLRPFCHLLLRHTQVMSPGGLDPTEAIRRALPFLERVLAAGSAYAARNPLVGSTLARLSQELNAYHAHEYLGQHWNPVNVADVAAELSAAKLSFGCSARILEHVPALALLPDQRALVEAIPDPGYRQTVTDVLRATRFRRDYWVKGPRHLGPVERAEALEDQRVVLIQPPETVTAVRAKTHGGAIELPLGAFMPIVEALSDFQPRPIGAVADALAPRGVAAEDVMQAVLVLCDEGTLQPAHDNDDAVAQAAEGAAGLNARILARSRLGGELGHLANPTTGGGTEVSRLQQLLLLAEASGAAPNEAARLAAEMLGLPIAEAEAAEAAFAGRRQVLRAQRVI